MTRKELINNLQALGMEEQAERELKALLQCIIAGSKADTLRQKRQQEYRWQVAVKNNLGCGFYWLQEARRKGWTKW